MGIDLRWGNRIDLEVTRGESFDVFFDIINRDGTIVDLTGWTAKLLLLAAPSSTDEQAIETYLTSDKLTVTGNRIAVKGILANAAIKFYRIKITSPDNSLTLYPYFGEIKLTDI